MHESPTTVPNEVSYPGWIIESDDFVKSTIFGSQGGHTGGACAAGIGGHFEAVTLLSTLVVFGTVAFAGPGAPLLEAVALLSTLVVFGTVGTVAFAGPDAPLLPLLPLLPARKRYCCSDPQLDFVENQLRVVKQLKDSQSKSDKQR